MTCRTGLTTTIDADPLSRFVAAQDGGIYDRALGELRAGVKRGHWLWFIFPQITGLGRSDTARYYAINGSGEAAGYLDHPVLSPRLADCTDAMLEWARKRTPLEILGGIDTMKFRSSMTLFDAVSPGGRFGRALQLLCEGAVDPATLRLLGSGPGA